MPFLTKHTDTDMFDNIIFWIIAVVLILIGIFMYDEGLFYVIAFVFMLIGIFSRN